MVTCCFCDPVKEFNAIRIDCVCVCVRGKEKGGKRRIGERAATGERESEH
jgi:hypothetical protein